MVFSILIEDKVFKVTNYVRFILETLIVVFEKEEMIADVKRNNVINIDNGVVVLIEMLFLEKNVFQILYFNDFVFIVIFSNKDGNLIVYGFSVYNNIVYVFVWFDFVHVQGI